MTKETLNYSNYYILQDRNSNIDKGKRIKVITGMHCPHRSTILEESYISSYQEAKYYVEELDLELI